MYAMQALLLTTLLISGADAGVLRSKSTHANVGKDAPNDGTDALDMLNAVEKELKRGSALSVKIQKATADENAGENKDEDDGFDDLNEGIAQVAADQKLASNQGVIVAGPKTVAKSSQVKGAKIKQVDHSKKVSKNLNEAEFHNLARGIPAEQKGLLAKVAQAGGLNVPAQKVSEKSLKRAGTNRKVEQQKIAKDTAMAHKAMEVSEELAHNIQEATAQALAKSRGRVGQGGMTAAAGSPKQRKAQAKDDAGQDLAKRIVKARKAVEVKKMAQQAGMGQQTVPIAAVAVRVVTDPAVAEVEAKLLGEGVKTNEAELLDAGMKAPENRKKEEQKAKAAALKKAEAERMAKVAADKATAKRKADAKAEADRKAAAKAAVQKALQKKRAAEKAEKEKKVAAKAAAQRSAEKSREAEKLAAEKGTADKVAAGEKALAKKLSLAAADKAKAKAAEEAHETAEKAAQDVAKDAADAVAADSDTQGEDGENDTDKRTRADGGEFECIQRC